MPKTSRSFSLRVLALGLVAGLLAASASAADTPLSASASTSSPPSVIVGSVQVKDISVSRGDNGVGLLTLTFDGPNAVADLRNLGSTLIVDVANGVVANDKQKPIDASSLATPIRRIDIAQTTRGSQLVVSTEGEFKSMAYQAGNRYVVEIAPPRQTQSPSLGAVQSAVSTTSRGIIAKQGYTGKPVTFNFQDVPVRTILQLIAEESGVNIVAADSVQGNVTLRLTRVPWDQALDIVLQAKSMDKRRSGNVIWVAPQSEIAKFEQDKEDARIALDNRADMTTEYIQINYHNAEEIFKALTEAKGIGGGSGAGGGGSSVSDNGFLSSRGKIVADARTNTLIVSDIPRKLVEMKKLIAVIDRPVDQVLIEARVVIANESFARDLGARFGVSGLGNNGNNAINSSIENNVGSQNSYAENNNGTATITRGIMSNLAVANPTGSVAVSILRAGFALDMELSALEHQGNGEVVSNPRIVTSNQREAVISQGREVGYVTLQPATAGGAATPNVQFKEVLMEMRVTPTITNDGRVFLDMHVKKDEVDGIIDTSIGQVPQIAKRSVNTAVLVQDGQTVVVGGVYEFQDRKDVAKVPFLGDVPFLGNLFKKRSKSKNKAELLIMVTPRVLRVAPPRLQ